jgi:hypothetical protein
LAKIGNNITATEVPTLITAQPTKMESIEKINWAIDQTTAWMLELTRLKQEIEQERLKRHLIVIK